MLSQKQQVQDQLSQAENDLSRCAKERDKHKLTATQQAAQIAVLKEEVRSAQDNARLLQAKVNEHQVQHRDELKRLKAEVAAEKTALATEQADLNQRLAEQTLRA